MRSFCARVHSCARLRVRAEVLFQKVIAVFIHCPELPDVEGLLKLSDAAMAIENRSPGSKTDQSRQNYPERKRNRECQKNNQQVQERLQDRYRKEAIGKPE